MRWTEYDFSAPSRRGAPARACRGPAHPGAVRHRGTHAASESQPWTPADSPVADTPQRGNLLLRRSGGFALPAPPLARGQVPGQPRRSKPRTSAPIPEPFPTLSPTGRSARRTAAPLPRPGARAAMRLRQVIGRTSEGPAGRDRTGPYPDYVPGRRHDHRWCLDPGGEFGQPKAPSEQQSRQSLHHRTKEKKGPVSALHASLPGADLPEDLDRTDRLLPAVRSHCALSAHGLGIWPDTHLAPPFPASTDRSKGKCTRRPTVTRRLRCRQEEFRAERHPRYRWARASTVSPAESHGSSTAWAGHMGSCALRAYGDLNGTANPSSVSSEPSIGSRDNQGRSARAALLKKVPGSSVPGASEPMVAVLTRNSVAQGAPCPRWSCFSRVQRHTFPVSDEMILTWATQRVTQGAHTVCRPKPVAFRRFGSTSSIFSRVKIFFRQGQFRLVAPMFPWLNASAETWPSGRRRSPAKGRAKLSKPIENK